MATVEKPHAGYVYVLRPQVLIDGKRIIKIGSTTRSVAERVRELENRSSVAFEAIYSIWVDDARALELQLHARYANHRMVGGSVGFYHLLPEDVIPDIEAIAAGHGGTSFKEAHADKRSAPAKKAGPRRKIAAPRVKASLEIASYIIWFLATMLLGFGAILYAPVEIPREFEVYAVGASLIVAAIVARVILVSAKRLIEICFFSHRFSPAMREKEH
ncbi:GIY-YIG nuclease family protein [Aliidongia dinghuensis]|nr:GIY-YIG nuclease family protein [Aliidongia dinghuensis]